MLIDQMKPKTKYFGNIINVLHMGETKLRIATGTPIKVTTENEQDWEFVFVDNGKRKQMAVF